MPRYHFDIETNHALHPDWEGSECIDRTSVRNIAISSLPLLAAEDLPDGDDYRAKVIVRDESGQPIFEGSLIVKARWLDQPEPMQ